MKTAYFKSARILMMTLGICLLFSQCRKNKSDNNPCDCKDSGLWIDGDGNKYPTESECHNLASNGKSCKLENDCDCD